VLSFTLGGEGDDPDIHVMANMFWEPLDMAVPEVPGRRWGRVIDTAQAAPDDIRTRPKPVKGDRYPVQGRSVVVLTAT
jgi:glycogen operon protein